MSTFDSSKTLNKQGTLRTTANTDILDMFGTIFGSAQFNSNNVLDKFGNLGKLSPTGPWKMQLASVETVSADMGTISNNYVNADNLTNFTSLDCTGYYSGNISGTGTFNIKNGPQTIGGVSYSGNGITIFSGTNTCNGILNMEANTNIQLGIDCTNSITRWAGGLTIGTGAVCTQYTAFTANTYLCQALTNTGTYNVTGCGVCGQGGLGLANTVANNGVINLDKVMWRNQSTWSGTGTVNVLSGATFQLSNIAIGSTTTLNLNGNGWKDATCLELGSLYATVGGVSIAMKINIQSATTIKTASGLAAVNLTNIISGTAPLTVTTTGSTLGGTFNFTNTANTYSGTLTLDKVITSADYGTSLQYANIVLVNGGRLSSSVSQTIGSLSSSDATSIWQIGGNNNVYIKSNGITQFDGTFSMVGSIANVWLEGGSANQLTLTHTNQTASIFARNGSKLILQGATFTAGSSGNSGQMRISAGSTISAGTTTTGACTYLSIDAASALDVYASGAGTGKLNVGTIGLSLTAGWKVNVLDALAVGTYPIIQHSNAAVSTLPTLGTNNTGHSVSFAWQNGVNPKILNMIVV